MFSTRAPRRFNRQPIYYDEHKQEIQRIHDDKMREMGLLPPRQRSEEEIRESIVGATKHLRKRVESGKKPLHPIVIVMIILCLVAIWRWLLSADLSSFM